MKRTAFLLLLLFICVVSWAAAEEFVRPEYTGSASVEVYGNTPSFDGVRTGDEFAQYSPLDTMGRVGYALALLGPKYYQAQRDEIQIYAPTGFRTTQYDFIPGGFLYNRCHMIAHRLTSSGDYKENLFTGTQYLNQGSMAKIEARLSEYITRTFHHVLYRVTPDFEAFELVCRGVIIEAQSVEDDEISFAVYCFNVQPGVAINYATGLSRLAETSLEGDLFLLDDPALVAEDATNPDDVTRDNVWRYVLNTRRKKFHLTTCNAVKTIAAENYDEYVGTRDELIDLGYSPCGTCNP